MTAKPWFINFNRLSRGKSFARPEMRLFCFPHAGGSAAWFHGFSRALPQGFELWAANLPAHGSRLGETPMTDLNAAADRLAAALVPLIDGIPFVFLGHSMGARLAFEVARFLRSWRIDMPIQLVVSACPAPQLPGHERGWYNLSDNQLVAELRKYGGLPEELLKHEPQTVALFLPALRADLRMFETAKYRQEQPLAIPIIALGSNRDPLVDVKELEAWQDQTSRQFRLALFDGDHFFLHAAQKAILEKVVR
ncbi:MAG: thioesterase II family protein [Anaerolineales bacterium]|jgi:medium-chain acyl-[acyl-carrier-protein] hydrolase